ncbi:MAG: FAD-binding protein [Rubrobacteraceae bacterium]|nr:FAD-binding protein [Rubrobacteraceae bacterium]
MTAIGPTAIERLRTDLRGTVYTPGEDGYDEGRRAFNLNAHQEPALVVVAEAAADIVAAVRLAREHGLGVGVLATGHGVANQCDGGVLVNTSRMRGVSVDPGSQTARVEAGALWSDVIPEAQAQG